MQQPLRLQRGDVLRLRRPHPCGNSDFEVIRLGADIGLRCIECDRRIMLARSLLERRLERFVSRSAELEPPADLDLSGFEPADRPPAEPPSAPARPEP